MFLMEGKSYVGKGHVMDINKLGDTIKYYLFSKRVNSVPRWFFKCGHTNGCHKTHNDWYLGLVALISSIVELLNLYS